MAANEQRQQWRDLISDTTHQLARPNQAAKLAKMEMREVEWWIGVLEADPSHGIDSSIEPAAFLYIQWHDM